MTPPGNPSIYPYVFRALKILLSSAVEFQRVPQSTCLRFLLVPDCFGQPSSLEFFEQGAQMLGMRYVRENTAVSGEFWITVDLKHVFEKALLCSPVYKCTYKKFCDVAKKSSSSIEES